MIKRQIAAVRNPANPFAARESRGAHPMWDETIGKIPNFNALFGVVSLGVMTNYDNISKRAYELWEKAGKPSGRDTEYWLQAENEVMERQQGTSGQRRSDQQSANDRTRRVGA
jgi:hypothetical protein